MKILVLLLIAGAVYYIIKELGAEKSTSSKEENSPGSKPTQAMLQCSLCGVHVPEQDGVRHEHQFFCGPEHKREFLEKEEV